MSMLINSSSTTSGGGGNSNGVFTVPLDVSGDVVTGNLDVSGIANLDKIKIGYTIDERDAVSSTHIYPLDCENQSYKIFKIRLYNGNSHNFDIKNVAFSNVLKGGQYFIILKVDDDDIEVDTQGGDTSILIDNNVYTNKIYTNSTLNLDVNAGSYCIVTYFVIDVGSTSSFITTVSSYKN